MKKYLLCLACLLGGAASADELADANKLMDGKMYPQAMAVYGKLAQAGNVEAQFHLGEMYLYGETGKIDLAQAANWFQKASAGGSGQAAGALQLIKERAERRVDIAYWTDRYDGADLRSGKFNCARPLAAAVSTTNDDIERVAASFATWQDCYNGFVQNVNSALPPGKHIPADVLRLMDQSEYDRAIAHVDAVFTAISADAAKTADAVVAEHAAWHAATQAYSDGEKQRQRVVIRAISESHGKRGNN